MISRIVCRLTLALALPALLLAPAAAQAELTYDPGAYFVQGLRAACADVTTIVRNSGDELISAPDDLTIIINGPEFDALSVGIRLFIYYHTCAQMFYGDRFEFADRYAVRTGVERGWLAVADVEAICVAGLLDGIWQTTPGEERCEIIRQTMIEALP